MTAQEGPVTKQEKPVTKKKKRSGWAAFGAFLVYGGWLLVVLVILGIVIGVSILTGGSK